ncbi:MAG: SRPBCC family protein [Armatimonadota bacterium]
MSIVLIIVGIFVVPILVAMIGGAMLPIAHVASVEKTLPAEPEKVWKLLTDLENQPKWRSEVKSIRVTSREPLSWVESSSFGEIPMKIDDEEANKRLVTRIDSTTLPFGGTWTYILSEAKGYTKLTITENGEVRQPIFRFLSKYVFGHTKTLNTYMSSLEAAVKKENK